MATPAGWNPSQATPYNPYANLNTASSNPRTIAANAQMANANQYGNANQYATAVQDYLGNIVNPMAQGQGGYNASETSNIEMSPQQQANMVASSSIAAGTPTMAAADAAQRAANAAGGNPAAVAAYRSRAANQAGALAGNAATNAETSAQQALAGETENVGQTRLGQQGQALNYLGGLQGEENQDAQNAANRQVQGAQTSLQASQTPSTFDQIAGGVGGALGAFLDEGSPAGAVPSYRAMPAKQQGTAEMAGNPIADRYLQGGRTAIVAEKDPEAVVKMNYLDDGDFGELDMSQPNSGPSSGVSQSIQPYTAPTPSMWQKLQAGMKNSMQSGGQNGSGSPLNMGQGGTNPGNIGNTVGKAVGSLAGLFADDGAIFTKPTKLSLEPDDQVVPLSYRADARTRPSAAIPLVDKIQKGKMYPGLAKGSPNMGAQRLPHV